MQEEAYTVPSGLPYRLRANITAAGFCVGLGVCALAVRLLDPAHPFRAFMEGATVSHRGTTALVLRPVSGDAVRAAAYVALAVAAVGFLVAVATSALA